MFSLLYYSGILPRGLAVVNRFLQENSDIFLQKPRKDNLFSKNLLLVEFGEGTLVRAVHQRVQHSAHQTADNEHGPDQPVIAVCCHQQEADQILGETNY